VRQPFNVNALAQVGALAALQDTAWVESCRQANQEGLRQIETGLGKLGLEYVPSRGNFVLTRVGSGRDVFKCLQAQGLIVRPVGGYGLPEWIRISVGTFEQNARVLAALDGVVAD
jgi:histidinol-phosphate aminotransferase